MFAAGSESASGLAKFVEINGPLLATIVFLVTYALIASEKWHKTVLALAGAAVMLVLGILKQETAFAHVDWNVIFLLLGMMILAGSLRRSGAFQWLAIHAARWTKGSPVRLMLVLLALTAVASALLDNVTTVVLIGPITVFLASRLGFSPLPLIIGEILASNIGGMATLIGDPPNLIVGSAAGLSFVDFLAHMAPIAVVLMIMLLVYARIAFRHELAAESRHREVVMEMDPSAAIVDPVLARRSAIVLSLTIVAFLVHGFVGLEPATIAISGAALLMVWARIDPHEALGDVEWTGLMFFVGLFIVVGGLVEMGVVTRLADGLADLTRGDPLVTALSILWFGGLASGIVDNIPLAAALVPIVHELSSVMEPGPLWWAVALGADLGGNLTVIGASANVILITMAEREGHKIGFRQFLVHGVPVTLGSLVIATLYLWLRYFLLAGG